MINAESRSMEWINYVSSLYPSLDKTLIEKSIRAFSLLESLVRSGCPFTFKGGTACMLHLGSSKRLSIDIDVICPPGTDIKKYVEEYSDEYGFQKIDLVERKSSHNVPKSHAKFFYQVSYVTSSEEDKILLDVLFEDIHYGKVEQLPIKSPFLKIDGEDVLVNVPSVADILGDKLTAFAPHTTGVPFFKEKRNCSLEIIKQMFDVASLFDVVSDFKQTRDTFIKFAVIELGYRELKDLSYKDILLDIINTSLCIALRGIVNPEDFVQLQNGIKRIGGLIIGEHYIIDTAIKDAAKAAYLATIILQNINSKVKRFADSSVDEIRNMTITTLNTKLNKLKKSNVEAFYYWALIDKILETNIAD